MPLWAVAASPGSITILGRAGWQPWPGKHAAPRRSETRQMPCPPECGRIAGLQPEGPAVPFAGSGAQLRSLLEAVPVGIWHLDARGRTVFGNHRLEALFGGAVPTSLADAPLELAGPPEPGGPFGFSLQHECEATLHRAERPPLRLLVAASSLPQPDGEAPGCLLSFHDVSALRAAQKRIEHLAEHDALTGLANRAALTCGLEAMANDPRGGALLMVDLDRLKSTNERHGHLVGDAMLRVAAERLRLAVRPSDLVARLGGDEFAVLVFGVCGEAALSAAERIRAALSRSFRHNGVELSISGSLGIACAPEHGLDAETLLRAADLATLEAKAQGRNAVQMFDPLLRDQGEARALLRAAFVAALHQDEFELHVQPQRNTETAELVGAEALIRWKSTRLGRWVPPEELLAAAGEAGLLQQLDLWVLRAAIKLQSDWRNLPGAPRRLGINISIASLHEPSFAEEVASALHRAGLPPDELEIEIPEDLAIRDLPGVARTLAALREVGVPLSLDDFGGGHSGLPHVVRLPVQRLKLDRSIVANLPDDPKAYAVLRATMALARGMGIEVIGEGVETEGQAEALRRVGCHILQGWLVARPMKPDLLLPAQAVLREAV